MIIVTSCWRAIGTATMLVVVLASMVSSLLSQAAEKKDGLKVLDIQRIAETDVLEDTRIERETLQGGYVCFKGFRRDTEVHLTEKDLVALGVSRTDPGVKTKSTVTRWLLVSISCLKQ